MNYRRAMFKSDPPLVFNFSSHVDSWSKGQERGFQVTLEKISMRSFLHGKALAIAAMCKALIPPPTLASLGTSIMQEPSCKTPDVVFETWCTGIIITPPSLSVQPATNPEKNTPKSSLLIVSSSPMAKALIQAAWGLIAWKISDLVEVAPCQRLIGRNVD